MATSTLGWGGITYREEQGLGLAKDAVSSVSQLPDALHKQRVIPHRTPPPYTHTHSHTHTYTHTPCALTALWASEDLKGQKRTEITDFPLPGDLLSSLGN